MVPDHRIVVESHRFVQYLFACTSEYHPTCLEAVSQSGVMGHLGDETGIIQQRIPCAPCFIFSYRRTAGFLVGFPSPPVSAMCDHDHHTCAEHDPHRTKIVTTTTD